MWLAFKRILIRMKPEMFIQLSELISDVSSDTGYGDVRVIIVDGLAQQLKAQKSYK